MQVPASGQDTAASFTTQDSLKHRKVTFHKQFFLGHNTAKNCLEAEKLLHFLLNHILEA
jgi:hypothetical protein